MNKKLSIIVPVYNAEQYIRPCIESIFRQGLSDEDYELIIVNDGTPDKSMLKIADLLSLHTNVTIVNQENQGLSVARNNGLARATGEYILFLDSDDILIEATLPIMLKKALTSKADMVIAEYLEFTDKEITKLSSTPEQPFIFWEEKTGRQLFMDTQGYLVPVVWRTLHRREFLQEHHIQFVPNLLFEDIPYTHECVFNAKKCLKTNLLFYIYRRRSNSITTQKYGIQEVEDYGRSLALTWNLRNKVVLTPPEEMKFRTVLFPLFYIFLSKLILQNLPRFSDRIHAIDSFSRQAPDLRFAGGRLQQLVTLLYRISPRTLMILWSMKWSWNNRLRKEKAKKE